jgi:hypothetical protein
MGQPGFWAAPDPGAAPQQKFVPRFIYMFPKGFLSGTGDAKG